MTLFFNILLNMTVCLLLTVAAEGILIFLITQKIKYVWFSFLCNIITNPTLNFIMLLSRTLSEASAASQYILLAVLELAVVSVEGIFYSVLTAHRFSYTLLLSLVLNTASFIVGVMLLW